MSKKNNKFKILIVEDEHFLSEMYITKFKHEGFAVFSASDGKEGLALLRKEMPDLVLLDIVMPVMDGYTFLKEMKKDEKINYIKVIILSNLGQRSEIEKGMNEGADDYLIKANLTPNQLVHKAREILEKNKKFVKKGKIC